MRHPAARDDGPNMRLFFAARPAPEAAAPMLEVGRQMRCRHGLGGIPIPRARLHVSLQPLGEHREWPGQLVALACQAASHVVQPPFLVTFNRVQMFGEALVLVGDDGVIGLESLHEALGAALREAGLKRIVKSRIKPHATLLRSTSGSVDALIAPISWTVRDFVLVHSMIGKARHLVVGRWALRDPANLPPSDSSGSR